MLIYLASKQDPKETGFYPYFLDLVTVKDVHKGAKLSRDSHKAIFQSTMPKRNRVVDYFLIELIKFNTIILDRRKWKSKMIRGLS